MYEALYLTQTEVELFTIIEDELLLALPLVAKHPAKECKITVGARRGVPKGEGAQKNKSSHPFAELEKLKSKKRG
jgi:uncharacterized protein